MKLGIVILNYNDYQSTEKLLKNIHYFENINDIVIVDNNSMDDSYNILKKYENEKITVLKSLENKGYSAGNNIGIKFLVDNKRDDIIAISNPDVKFDENFINTIMSDFINNEDYSIITGLQMQPNGKGVAIKPFWTLYDANLFIKIKISKLLLFRWMSSYKYDYKYVENILSKKPGLNEVGTVEGSLFFIRAEDLIKVGMFDEKSFLYYEEDILANKISKERKKIGVNTSISYIHYGSVSIGKSITSIKKKKIMQKSSMYYFETYLSKNIFMNILHRIICFFYIFETKFILMMRRLLKFRNGETLKEYIKRLENK